jgi:signal transduction histidine kinase
MGDYSNAANYAGQAIEAVSHRRDMDLEMDAYRILQKVNFEAGNYEQAYRYQTAASLLHDTILSEKKAALIAELQNRAEIEQTQNALKLLNKDNEIKALTIKKQMAFRNSLIIGTCLLIIIGILLVNQYRISVKRKRQYERRRISSDLHDDIGSSLSKITLLSQVLMQRVNDDHSIAQLAKISEAATDALEKMSEMVWSLNPKNDQLENLLSYIRKYAVEFFEPTDIACSVHLPDEIVGIEISGEQRRNIFLTVKEALHNVVKHANATKVDLSFPGFGNSVQIVIHDNGKGIAAEELNKFGNGLQNMKQRMADAGGKLSVENGEGTTIRLELNLQHNPKG